MITSQTRIIVAITCDECGVSASRADDTHEAIEQAIDEGFWRVSYPYPNLESIAYSVLFYCKDCANKKKDEILKIKNVSIRCKE